MKISVKVKPNAGESKVEKVAEGQFAVKVKAPACPAYSWQAGNLSGG